MLAEYASESGLQADWGRLFVLAERRARESIFASCKRDLKSY
jgi:hypothetical protein